MVEVLMRVVKAPRGAVHVLTTVAYYVGWGIARAAAVCAVVCAIVLFFGGLLVLILHDHLIRAALWWFIGGALLPLVLRLFQVPFLFVGGLLMALSGHGPHTHIARASAPKRVVLCVAHPIHPHPARAGWTPTASLRPLRLHRPTPLASRHHRNNRITEMRGRKSA